MDKLKTANRKLFNTPILFLIFNRPDLTWIVFERIREVKPKYLFIGADGPRDGYPDDTSKCKEARNAVIYNIDWNCQVKTLFRDKNLGCGLAVSQAISWFFENVDEGIILEDDCYPSYSFFYFCQKALKHYNHCKKVMHITGCNFQLGKRRGNNVGYFSKYAHVWGWATWAKSWSNYKFEKLQKNIELGKISSFYGLSTKELNFWKEMFHKSFGGFIDTWDYQWQYTLWVSKGVAINSNYNLVKNLGLNSDSTHKNTNKYYSKLELEEMPKDKIAFHNDLVINKSADRFTFQNFYFNQRNSKIQTIRKYISMINRNII